MPGTERVNWIGALGVGFETGNLFCDLCRQALREPCLQNRCGRDDCDSVLSSSFEHAHRAPVETLGVLSCRILHRQIKR